MIVTLPSEKVNTIIQKCLDIFKQCQICIRALARLLGLIVSSFSAVEYAPLHYRKLEKAKINALKNLKQLILIQTWVGWLVGCFGLNGPLRQYFSLYRAVSQREGEKKEE